MAFIAALLLLVAFIANVAIGAIGDGPLVGNVTEMIMLLLASIAFVAGILQREATEKKRKPDR
jgi:uncharacterized membrane protein